MKIELTTDVCRLFRPDTYGSELCYEVEEEYWDDVKQLAKDLAEDYLREAMQETELFDGYHARVTVTKFGSPKWYNYQTDWIEFDLELINNIRAHVIEKYFDDDNFFKYIEEEFGSYSGFASWMPIERKEFFKQLSEPENTNYHFERAIAMVLHYEIMISLGKDMDEWERDYMMDWREQISQNGYDIDEEDDED